MERNKTLAYTVAALLLALAAAIFRVYIYPRTALSVDYRLVRAARLGNDEDVLKCVESGANVNAKAVEGLNAIQVASYEGHTSTVLVLLDRGASPNDGIWGAVAKGHVDTVKVLLGKGADANRRDAENKTLLSEAKSLGLVEVAKLLRVAGARE